MKCHDEFVEIYGNAEECREVCRGVYLQETEAWRRRAWLETEEETGWTNRTFFEVISWKSEGLPAAMKKFFSLVGAREGEGGDPPMSLMMRLPNVYDDESWESSDSDEVACPVS